MKQLGKYDIDLQQVEGSLVSLEFDLDDCFFGGLQDAEIEHGKLKAWVQMSNLGERYEAAMTVKGSVQVPCDRCLELMTIPVEAEQKLVFKLGEAYEELSDELIVIDEESRTVHLDWYLYEMIALSLPMRRVHDEGECNPEMEQYLSGSPIEEETTDPRWEMLKQIKDNNN